MGQRTPLYDLHLALGAKMVDFGGWDMPLHYGSQVEEHHEVRRDCGVFDVSHMTVIDVDGPQAKAWLQHLLANDVERLHRPGRALYSTMLNERGGIVDDMIVYRLEDRYRLVFNASTRDQDLAWMQAHVAGYEVQLHERQELAMLAIQGPQARHKIAELVTQSRAALIQHLKPFEAEVDGDWFIARTGYTGEDGLEIALPAEQAPGFFNDLVGAGISPIGLGARDTLRLEKGYCLYGNDIDDTTSPLEAGLGWITKWNKDFTAKDILLSQKERGMQRNLVGFEMLERGIPRQGYDLVDFSGAVIGYVTSGTQSPSLNKAIGMGYVRHRFSAIDSKFFVKIRDKLLQVKVVKLPFLS